MGTSFPLQGALARLFSILLKPLVELLRCWVLLVKQLKVLILTIKPPSAPAYAPPQRCRVAAQPCHPSCQNLAEWSPSRCQDMIYSGQRRSRENPWTLIPGWAA